MADLKKIQKSIRMTEQIYKVIDNFDGNGFNEKFQNFVLHAIACEKRLTNLDLEIQKSISSLQEVVRDINDSVYRRN